MGVYCGCVDGPDGKETPHAKWFREAWVKAGKKLDMGRACLRVKKLEDLALDVLGEAIRRVPARTYMDEYLKLLAKTSAAKEGRKAATAKTPKPATAAKRKKQTA